MYSKNNNQRALGRGHTTAKDFHVLFLAVYTNHSNKQVSSFITGVLSKASAALHFTVPSGKRLLVAAMIDHRAVFEEPWKVIQVHP